ncbi:membrane metalloprotease [Flavobacterium ovatum]|uniref:membrane metalloprotease n=1 Tax=Flavobacterium ovatum TaxID=1928857 RepID=UPI00344EB944
MKKATVLLLSSLFLLLSCSKEDDTSKLSPEGFPKSSNQKNTGTSANDMLANNAFKSMVIEVAYVQGFEPSTTAINNFVAFLNERINKPDGIRVVKRVIASTGKTSFTDQEIIDIEVENRTLYNTDSEIAVWAYFADGESSKNTTESVVLGTAYRNTSFVIFQKTVQRLSGSFNQPNRSTYEATVIEHEFGHILGLTNLGTTLQSNHEDTTNEKHCITESCLMYWSTGTGGGISSMISGGSVPKLDTACLADLKANGGK